MDNDGKLPELKDHFLVQFILGNLVEQVCGCEFVPSQSIDEIDSYPFVSFNWITLGTDTTSDWLKGHPQYICTMQIDIHATSNEEASSLATKLYSALKERSYRELFTQAHIVPQDISNTSNRTVLMNENIDHDFGFDVTFLVTGGFVYELDELNFVTSNEVIESLKLNENGNSISLNKIKEE